MASFQFVRRDLKLESLAKYFVISCFQGITVFGFVSAKLLTANNVENANDVLGFFG